MSKTGYKVCRRQFIKFGVAGAATLSVGGSLLGAAANAQSDLPKLDPNDSMAQQLGYSHDAKTVDTARWTKRAEEGGADQFCRTCQFYQGADAQWGPCTIFAEKQVSANGWCNSWFKRAG